MPHTKSLSLCGWGNTHQAETKAYRPEATTHTERPCSEASLIAYGSGRSYADAALNANATVLTQRLNRFRAFDINTGLMTIEAGVTLAEIMEAAIPRGWFVPVLPGTRFVTAGGAVACNVHGKNHVRTGNFGTHVRSFTLRMANGEVRECTPETTPELFWATTSGMGMTGIIQTVTVQLRAIKSLSLRTETRTVSNLQQMVECFREAVESHEYTVGWIDHFSKGEQLGRGVFEKANHISMDEGGASLTSYTPPKSGPTIPRCFPSFALNKLSMALYNRLRFGKYNEQWKAETKAFDSFFHPLDSLQHWNRMYGKKGFYQYQCIIPESANVAEQLQQLLKQIQQAGLFSFLAVMKYHREADASPLCFPLRGFSLALDFPAHPKLGELTTALDEQLCNWGGRIYLAKDGLLTPQHFQRMYGEKLPAWRSTLQQVDPQKKFNSLMSDRLGFREAKHD